jgi:Na+/glutamate symporter
MKFPWFKRYGIIFLPASITGGIIFLAAIVAAVYEFIRIDSKSHSVSDTLMNLVFYLIIIFIVYSLIALLTSMQGKKA